ncbi:MAG: hypothetical protein H0X62_00250 [Bacteroidetes bacterium]|nr:hypothetical protein [Bacteroidota bacterium]
MFKPFEKVAGFKALYIGLLLILLTGVTGYFAGLNFDGVLDAHFLKTELSLASHLLEGIINWLSLSVLILISGLIFSGSKFRIIDVFGTQALARWPMVFLAIVAIVVPYETVTQYIMWKATGVGEEVFPQTIDIILFALFSIISILVIVWMVVLMYRAYSISCNIKGTKGVISFIVALILAEILSKTALSYMYNLIG